MKKMLALGRYPFKENINHSYENIFRFVFRNCEPALFLEWGPGYSTYLAKTLNDKMYIHSIESDPMWYMYHSLLFENEKYLCIFDGINDPDIQRILQFDAIVAFIDNKDKERYFPYRLCRDVIKPDILIFHDAERHFKEIKQDHRCDLSCKDYEYYIDDFAMNNRKTSTITLALSNKYNFKEWE